MSDRELLELAAKAAGVNIKYNYIGTQDARCTWNPLEDDGDALRLAVNLGIHILPYTKEYLTPPCTLPQTQTRKGDAIGVLCEIHNEDANKATRRAIVRAAAEIAKQR